MRNLLVILFVLYGFSSQATLFVQPVNAADTSKRPSGPYRAQDGAERYHDRARKLFTVGGILAGVGAGMGTVGVLLIDNANNNNDDDFGQTLGGIFLTLFGVLTFTAGCVLIGLGAGNKAKANRMSFAFKPEKVSMVKGATISKTYYPAFGLTIRL